MIQGFVTIATGDERYYRMAQNLLRSYRQNASCPMRFALIADRRNAFTEEFDDVIILDHPTNTWMDKLSLLQNCPYDENIFVDADCTVYRDINFFWDLFAQADDFSCFGKALPMDSTEGWFTKEAAQLYPIHFITHLHGMLYFVRKGNTIDQMYTLCQEIIKNYYSVKYKGFNDRLADEPVFALAMSVMNLKPIDRKPDYYCFVPYATKISTNYLSRKVIFSNPTDGTVSQCCIVHWGNQNTYKAQYRFDTHIINDLNTNKTIPISIFLMYKMKLLFLYYKAADQFNEGKRWCQWFFERVAHKLISK